MVFNGEIFSLDGRTNLTVNKSVRRCTRGIEMFCREKDDENIKYLDFCIKMDYGSMCLLLPSKSIEVTPSLLEN